MYYEFSGSVSRETIKFIFKGKELLEPARKCWTHYKNEEITYRNKLADLLRDQSVSQNDRRIGELKEQIEHCGRQAEACSVFTVGFEREPEREFHLSIGDVVFFGLNQV